MRPPLLLTGGPASGKSTTARQLASGLDRAAVVDVDDIRHLVVAGHAAPWEGDEGEVQQRIGVENACDLACRFLASGIEVVLSDVVDPRTAHIYRDRLAGLVLVRLRLSLAEARRRATLRPVHLTEEEFEALHALEATDQVLADHIVDVAHLSVQEQSKAVMDAWAVGAA